MNTPFISPGKIVDLGAVKQPEPVTEPAQTSAAGHNSEAAELADIAAKVRQQQDAISKNDEDSIARWLVIGEQLNRARQILPSNNRFHEWMVSQHLAGMEDMERLAAMWGAAHPAHLTDLRAAHPRVRTLRGFHAKWKEEEDAREAEEARAHAAEQQRLAEIAKAQAEARAAEERAAQEAAAAERDEEARIAAEGQVRAAAQERKAAEDQSLLADLRAKKSKKAAIAAEKKVNKPKGGAHVSHNSGDDEWYTPVEFIDAARAVLGGFDLDPATSVIANQTVRATKIFTAEDDGLTQDWPVGRIWMNPPYAQPLMGQFASKYAQAIRDGSEGVVLVNNATETAWFREMAVECSAICFPTGRIKFLDPEGKPSGAPLQGQAIIYSGPNPDAFEAVFGAFGFVARLNLDAQRSAVVNFPTTPAEAAA